MNELPDNIITYPDGRVEIIPGVIGFSGNQIIRDSYDDGLDDFLNAMRIKRGDRALPS